MTGSYLLFQLAGRRFGVKLEGAIEILPGRSSRPVPLSYSYVDGLLDYRGSVYPVYNLSRRIGIDRPEPIGFAAAGQAEQAQPGSIILLEEKGMPFGIMVDSVVKMARLEEEPASPEKVQGIDPRYVRGIVSEEYQEALILDFERLFHAG